jgi:hypothetical protein
MSSSGSEALDTLKKVGKRKRTRIPAVTAKEWDSTDDDETQLTQDDKTNRGTKKLRLSPQSTEYETKNNSKKSKYFSNSQLSDDELIVVVSQAVNTQVETCVVCKTSFANFSVEKRTTHINHCLDQQASEDYLKKAKLTGHFSTPEEDDTIKCVICDKDITKYPEKLRAEHVDACCKKTEKKKSTLTIISNSRTKKLNLKPKEPTPVPIEAPSEPPVQTSATGDDLDNLYSCFVCKKNITSLGIRARIKHLKLCAKLHNIQQNDVKRMLELQKEQHKANADKEKQIARRRKRKTEPDAELDLQPRAKVPKAKKKIIDDDETSIEDNASDGNIFNMFKFGKSNTASGTVQDSAQLEQLQDVDEWLAFLGMIEYASLFSQNGYDTLEVCAEMEQDDLTFISKAGHKKRILLAAKQLKQVTILKHKRDFRRQQHELEMQQKKEEQERREAAKSRMLLQKQKEVQAQNAPLLQTEYRKSSEEIAQQLREEFETKIPASPVHNSDAEDVEELSSEEEQPVAATQPMSKSRFAPKTPPRNIKPGGLFQLAKLGTPKKATQSPMSTPPKQEQEVPIAVDKTDDDFNFSSLGEEEAQIVAQVNDEWMSFRDDIEPANVSVSSEFTEPTPIKLQLDESVSNIVLSPPTKSQEVSSIDFAKTDDDNIKSQNMEEESQERPDSPELFEDDPYSDESDTEPVMKRKSVQSYSPVPDFDSEFSPFDSDMADSNEQNDAFAPSVSELDSATKHDAVVEPKDADKVQEEYIDNCAKDVDEFKEKVKAMYAELSKKLEEKTQQRDKIINTCAGSSQLYVPDFTLDPLHELFITEKPEAPDTTEDWADCIDWNQATRHTSPKVSYGGRNSDFGNCGYSTQAVDTATLSDSESEKGYSPLVFTQPPSPARKPLILSQEKPASQVVEIPSEDDDDSQRPSTQEVPKKVQKEKPKKKATEPKKTKTKKKTKAKVPLETEIVSQDNEASFYHTQEKENTPSDDDEYDLSDSDSETRVINWKKKHELREKLVNNVMGTSQVEPKKKLILRKEDSNKSSKPAASSSSSQKSKELPDFDSMSIDQLKTLLSQYGVKSGPRKFMIEKLSQIHSAMHQ